MPLMRCTKSSARRRFGSRVMLALLATSSSSLFSQGAGASTTATTSQAPGAPAMGAAPATEPAESPPDKWYHVGGQATFIEQFLFPFTSPYSGPHSLPSEHEERLSQTYTLYLGARPLSSLELFLDPEMARGKAIGESLGLAGITNGDVIRNPAIGQDPYLARYFARWSIDAGGEREHVEASDHQVAGYRSTERVVFSAGKLATTDIFDVNSYANNTRTQFMNWSLINNTAYDYAADTRGYSHGIAVEWVHPDWALRAGSFQMPTTANGPDLSTDIAHSRGDQIEGEYHAHLWSGDSSPLIVRLLGFRNLADMGSYRAALSQAQATGTTPDITAVRQPGAVKYGFGLNLEQALADEGATGLFMRLGWSDGATESFAFTESDRSLSIGTQIGGVHWSRPDDRLGIAFAVNGLSAPHRDYLAAGGLGFLLGDGKLNYATEQIFESYYAWQFCPFAIGSLDVQLVNNPGYNSDRGPVTVLSLRLHVAF
jgi:hypothetical protein